MLQGFDESILRSAEDSLEESKAVEVCVDVCTCGEECVIEVTPTVPKYEFYSIWGEKLGEVN